MDWNEMDQIYFIPSKIGMANHANWNEIFWKQQNVVLSNVLTFYIMKNKNKRRLKERTKVTSQQGAFAQ